MSPAERNEESRSPGLGGLDSSGSDFVPGTRVLFAQDFSAATPGATPDDLEEITIECRSPAGVKRGRFTFNPPPLSV